MNRLISWFAQNGIAANLLMVFIIAGGVMTIPRLKQEVFPELSSDRIQISVEYRGAAPEEVEEGICQRVEEAVYGLAGIKKITSTAREGLGSISIELVSGADLRRVLDQVKTRVDAIDTFPVETETPVVEELILRRQVVEIAVSGDTDERSLRTIAERVRDEVAALEGISRVELAGARPYEISIEVSEEALRRHGLALDDVARAVRRSSLDLPGGSLKTRGGEVLVRAKGQAYRGEDFERLTLLSRRDGTRITLGEVATVIDGFEDEDRYARFDGEPAILVQVFRVGDQGALDIAAAVKRYVADAAARMPEGISLTSWQDESAVLRGRLDLMIDNGIMGLILVCVCLALFLRLELAFWVAWGIPLSFLGTVWLLPSLGVSVNVISLFAFIVVLGLVVDDAIVAAENVYTHLQRGERPLEAAIAGACEVGSPVVFAVLTSIAAFVPLLNVPGNLGKVMKVIPAVVIATLIFSLIEALFILPAHLAHLRAVPNGPNGARPWILKRAWLVFQSFFTGGLRRFTERIYSPVLEWAIAWRYLTVALGVLTLSVALGMFAGGHLRFVFFPEVDADNVVAFVTMPQGTPVEVTERAVRQLEEAAMRVRASVGEGGAESPRASSAAASAGSGAKSGPPVDGSILRHIFSAVGTQPYREAQDLRRGRSASFSGSHFGEVNIDLIAAEDRRVSSAEIGRLWRAEAGPIPDAVELTYTASLFSPGEPINVQLASTDVADLRAAAESLKLALRAIAGVRDITDSFRAGKREVKLGIKPEAEMLGLSLADLAQQVRQGFYGEEAQRIQRGRDDVRVMVRYPRAERRSLGDLESMRVRTATGVEVAFGDVAELRYGRGYAAIQRADRQRIINVIADVDQEVVTANEVLAELERSALPALARRYPGVSYTLEGEQREQRETFSGLIGGFVMSLVMIYALLAIPFQSYFQPFIVMAVIPFGVVGVIVGHLIMGLPLTFLSLFGLVALTGIVVNDSLIMVDFINRERRAGGRLAEAVRAAGVARFRPIFLTSLTTFAGLSPLLFEKSMQAQFLIPMAASLGFGVVAATFVSLLLVPVTYVILEDFLRLFRTSAATEER